MQLAACLPLQITLPRPFCPYHIHCFRAGDIHLPLAAPQSKEFHLGPELLRDTSLKAFVLDPFALVHRWHIDVFVLQHKLSNAAICCPFLKRIHSCYQSIPLAAKRVFIVKQPRANNTLQATDFYIKSCYAFSEHQKLCTTLHTWSVETESRTWIGLGNFARHLYLPSISTNGLCTDGSFSGQPNSHSAKCFYRLCNLHFLCSPGLLSPHRYQANETNDRPEAEGIISCCLFRKQASQSRTQLQGSFWNTEGLCIFQRLARGSSLTHISVAIDPCYTFWFPQYKLVLSYKATSNEQPRKQLLNQNIFFFFFYRNSTSISRTKNKSSCSKPKQVCCINEATHTQTHTEKNKKRDVHWPLQAGKSETWRLRGTVACFRLF